MLPVSLALVFILLDISANVVSTVMINPTSTTSKKYVWARFLGGASSCFDVDDSAFRFVLTINFSVQNNVDRLTVCACVISGSLAHSAHNSSV